MIVGVSERAPVRCVVLVMALGRWCKGWPGPVLLLRLSTVAPSSCCRRHSIYGRPTTLGFLTSLGSTDTSTCCNTANTPSIVYRCRPSAVLHQGHHSLCFPYPKPLECFQRHESWAHNPFTRPISPFTVHLCHFELIHGSLLSYQFINVLCLKCPVIHEITWQNGALCLL